MKTKSIWRIRDSILSAIPIHLKRVKKKLSFSLDSSHRMYNQVLTEKYVTAYTFMYVYIILYTYDVVMLCREWGPSRDCLIHFYFPLCIGYLDLPNYKLPVILNLTGLKLASKKQLDPLTKLVSYPKISV